MAALALVGTMMTGCTSDDLATEKPQQNNNSTVTLTTTIVLDGSATTRALDADGKKTFAKGDKIAIIYKNTSDKTVKAESSALETTDISSDGKKAKITVTLNDPKASGQLRCIYPAAMAATTIDTDVNVDHNLTIDFSSFLNNQDGKLETIASNYDLAIFDGTFTSDAELPTEVTLKNQLAIVEFTIKDYDGNDITSTITKLEIEQGPGLFGYSLTRTAAAGPIYVAMIPPSESDKDNITITATNSDGTSYERDFKFTLAANNIYPLTVKTFKVVDMLHTPLTLEATEDATTITVTNATAKTFQYAKNGGDRITVPGTDISISINTGDIVQFYSTNAGLGNGSLAFNIQPDKKTYVYGNVMSLIDDGTEGFANDKTIEGEDALRGLFKDASLLASHAMKKILLPATTLKDGCYQDMFNGCTGLTTAPDLPATTLATDCYTGMFKGCTGLTSLPEKLLPAKTLANNCYVNMFYGCTGLTSLPADLLPAKTLALKCYEQMFHSCTGLTTLPANLLPATTLESQCYAYMFTGCSGLTTLPANLLPVTTLYNSCYWGMFEKCTSLTTAPDLPAQTLVGYCYYLLFDGCTKLSSVKCLATDISATNCLTDWLKGAGTADGCERKLYVDPSTTFSDNDWKLDSSGEDGKRWTTNSNSVAASQ